MAIIERNPPEAAEDLSVSYDDLSEQFVVFNKTSHTYCGQFSAINKHTLANRMAELIEDAFRAGERAAQRKIRAALGL